MTAAPLAPRSIDYHIWRTRSVTVASANYTVATEPGLTVRDANDATAHLAERMVIPLGATVVSFQWRQRPAWCQGGHGAWCRSCLPQRPERGRGGVN